MTLVTLGAELRRVFLLARSYWLEYVSDFVLYFFGFLLLLAVFHAASDTVGPDQYLSTLIGYVVWKIGASIMASIADIAVVESRTGTLEQLLLTGQRAGLVFLGRSTSLLLNYTTRGLLLGAVLAAVLGILRPIPVLAIIVFILTIAGAGGLGFGLAGLGLVYKQIGGLVDLTWQMLVFFTGALAPLAQPALAAVAKTLPLSWGIAGLRAIMLEGATAASLWRAGELPGLLLNTACYMAFGAALFAWGQKRARALGVLSHY
ncbi:MAG: ABC transporter permease [Anaerolineae bacterium]|nr:ABC transporter permease [Anaerolineae bacterium]